MEGNAVELKTYQSYTMAEALAAVKRDLGADAVILHTRSFQRGGMLGLGQKTIVEVTARANSDSFTVPSPISKSSPSLRGQRAYAQSAGATATLAPPLQAPAHTQEPDRERTRRLAQSLLEQHQREQKTPSPAPKTSISRDFPVVSTPVPGHKTPGISHQVQKPATSESTPQRFFLTPTDQDHAPTNDANKTPAPENMNHLQGELSAIRTMVGQVLQRQTTPADSSDPDLPQHLFDLYLNLIAQDLSRDLAERISSDVRGELGEDALEDEELVHHAVLKSLAAHIPCAEQPVADATDDGRPLTLALVGPTGVGKTTTLAKLAATFKLREGKRVGVITADTYRIAAVDQLRTYTNIIGLPLQVALTPGEMRQAVHQLSDCDVILIDTAGRSQNDTERLEELKTFLAAADPHEVHLVLSTTADQKVMLREAEAFASVGVDKVVLTKLDEAVNFGMLVNVINLIGKELSFFTTGQEVPDHIERSHPERLAQLILGEEVHA